jgi:uncharacterized protein YndB with AHSA1/START domain
MSTTVTTPSDVEVVMTRAFDAPRELVFEAFTGPAHLPNWMGGYPGWSMTTCDVDLRPGGAYRYVWKNDDGEELVISGVFREVEPPERIVATEEWGYAGGDWPETVVTTVFAEEDGRTTTSVTVVYPSREARDAALQTGMTDGAGVSYDQLEAYLRKLA